MAGIWFIVAVAAGVGLMNLLFPRTAWPRTSPFRRSPFWLGVTRSIGVITLAFAVWIATTST